MTRRPLRRAVSVAALALFTLAGCGDTESEEPTASQAGATLKIHITQMLEKVQASNIKVTDPGGKDIPCGEGRAKQTYGATAVDDFGSGDPAGLVTNMIGGLTGLADYKIESPKLSETKRELVSTTAHTRIVLDSPSRKQYMATGQTDCLPVG